VKADGCADEEEKDKRKGKGKCCLLEKVVLDKLDRGMRSAMCMWHSCGILHNILDIRTCHY